MYEAARRAKHVCRKVMKENHVQYVEKKQVPRDIFGKYFEVIELNLHQKIIGQDGEMLRLSRRP